MQNRLDFFVNDVLACTGCLEALSFYEERRETHWRENQRTFQIAFELAQHIVH